MDLRLKKPAPCIEWIWIGMKSAACCLGLVLCFGLTELQASSDNPVLQWERLRIRPAVTVVQIVSDNVFLESADIKQESITKIAPELKFDVALSETFLTHLYYRYERFEYAQYANFRRDHHYAGLSLKRHTPKGSHLVVGGDYSETAVQPFFEDDESKVYRKSRGYAETVLIFSDIFEVHSELAHVARRFDDDAYAEDDFDRNTFALDFLYRKLLKLPLLVAFDVMQQNDRSESVEDNDLTRYRGHVGARWKATEKLKGDLKAGYLVADFERSEDDGTLSVETDLTYDFSEITTLSLELYRNIVPSTRVERETGDYFILTGGSFGIRYGYFDPLSIQLRYRYEEKDFPYELPGVLARLDKRTLYEGTLVYNLRKTAEFTLRYEYRENESSWDEEDYKENRYIVSIALFL